MIVRWRVTMKEKLMLTLKVILPSERVELWRLHRLTNPFQFWWNTQLLLNKLPKFLTAWNGDGDGDGDGEVEVKSSLRRRRTLSSLSVGLFSGWFIRVVLATIRKVTAGCAQQQSNTFPSLSLSLYVSFSPFIPLSLALLLVRFNLTKDWWHLINIHCRCKALGFAAIYPVYAWLYSWRRQIVVVVILHCCCPGM